MKKYIDTDLLLQEVEDNRPLNWSNSEVEVQRDFDFDLFKHIIGYQPPADVVDVRHGRWALHTDGSGTCSECKKTQKNVWDCDSWQNYCGHCGARMDGEQKEGDI